jgi:excisionase family DNA binding protein
MISKHEILTIKELADYLRVHTTTIYRLLRQRRLPSFRVGSEWRFNRAAIEQWQRSQATNEPKLVSCGRRRKAKSSEDV